MRVTKQKVDAASVAEGRSQVRAADAERTLCQVERRFITLGVMLSGELDNLGRHGLAAVCVRSVKLPHS
jgi:hypothetical protein